MADEKQDKSEEKVSVTDGLEFSDNGVLDDVQATEKVEPEIVDEPADAEVHANKVEVHTIGMSRGKKVLIFLIAILVIAAAAWLYLQRTESKKATTTKTTGSQQVASVTTATISISAKEVTPATVTIKKGQIVTWKNADTVPHQIAADPYPTNTSLPELGKGEVLQPGDVFSFAYEKAGTYTYHDNLNPYVIKGVVVVQ